MTHQSFCQIFSFDNCQKYYVGENRKFLFMTVSVLVALKSLFFTFIRNRIVPVLRKKCGKTCVNPVKYTLENFGVYFNWVKL